MKVEAAEEETAVAGKAPMKEETAVAGKAPMKEKEKEEMRVHPPPAAQGHRKQPAY